MRLLDLTLADAAANLALDEALLLEAEACHGGEVLRLWEWPRPVVVLGAGGSIGDDVHEDNCRADGVPILRRSSGGGTVLLGSGCLCYSLVLAYARSPALSEIRSSYTFILSRVADALEGLPTEPHIAGISDLEWEGRKLSGNAQQRKRDHLLHHGTLLYDFDLSLLGRYLREPARQPEYRAGRTHRDFVRNLSCTATELRSRLAAVFRAEATEADWPRERVALLTARYLSPEWVRRR